MLNFSVIVEVTIQINALELNVEILRIYLKYDFLSIN